MKTPREYKEMEFRGLLLELVRLFQPHTYVEIGVKEGYTFNAVAPLVKRAVAVDPVKSPSISYAPNIYFYQMPSAAFAGVWAGKKDPHIDLLFIDGDHSSNAVLEDFLSISPFVKKHTGLILFHDTYPIKPELTVKGRCHDAWLAASFIHKRHPASFEIVTLPGPWAGLSIARKLSDGIEDPPTHGWMEDS